MRREYLVVDQQPDVVDRALEERGERVEDGLAEEDRVDVELVLARGVFHEEQLAFEEVGHADEVEDFGDDLDDVCGLADHRGVDLQVAVSAEVVQREDAVNGDHVGEAFEDELFLTRLEVLFVAERYLFEDLDEAGRLVTREYVGALVRGELDVLHGFAVLDLILETLQRFVDVDQDVFVGLELRFRVAAEVFADGFDGFLLRREYLVCSDDLAVELLELDEHVLDGRPVQRVADEDRGEELDEERVVVELSLVLRVDQLVVFRGDSGVELGPVWVVEEELAGEQLVEETADGPDVAGSSRAASSSAVEVFVVAFVAQREVEHLDGLDELGASVLEVELFVFVEEDPADPRLLALAEVCERDGDGHGAEVGVWGDLGDGVDEDVVALDVVVRDVVRVAALDRGEGFEEDLQVQRQHEGERQPLRLAPGFEAGAVALHDDVVLALVDAVVVHGGDVGLQTEVLETGDLGEDVVQHAALVDALFEGHDFDGHFARVADLGHAVVDDSVGARGESLPVLVDGGVVEVFAEQLEQPLAGRERLEVAHVVEDERHDVFVGFVVEVEVEDVQVVEDAAGWVSGGY